MSYELIKALHILGAVLFMGNIIVTALWKGLADRTRNAAVIGFSQRLVIVTDMVFTATGVALLAMTGPAMAMQLGGMGVTWVAWGAALFGITGVIWIAVLVPIEIRQARLAREFARTGDIPRAYWRLNQAWNTAGIMATLLPLVVMFLMVMKPV